MKVLVPEIATHVLEGGEGRNQAVLAADFHPSLPVLVSAGAGENRVIIWILEDSGDQNWVSFACELTSSVFDCTVNIVRFSPCGTYLACGDSNGLITILSVREEGKSWMDAKEERILRRVQLRGHTMDVQDLAWSPDSKFCASAGMDNLIIVWDAMACAEMHRIKSHTHYAQGVAWSPDGQYIASTSFDETMQIHKFAIKNKKITIEECAILKKPRLFADEFKAPTFCRRLAFSPDQWSRLLVVPGGLTRDDGEAMDESKGSSAAAAKSAQADKELVESTEAKRPLNHCAHIFRLTSTGLADNSPVATLAGYLTASLAVRFHPHAFELIPDSEEPYLEAVVTESLKLRYIFAVATTTCILLYDTQHSHPIAMTDKLHYASYTDLTWHVASDGTSTLVGSSRDGCFSMLRFEPNELGVMKPIPRDVAKENKKTDLAANEENCAVEGSKNDAEIPKETQNENASSPTKVATPLSNPAQSGKPGDISSPIAIVDENSSSSQPMKKRRIQVQNITAPSTNTATSVATSESPKVTVLQPRRVKLETLKPA